MELDEGNIDNETALHIMVKRKRLCPLVSLITHGANVDAVSNDGNTPLHYAVQVICYFYLFIICFVIKS